MKKLIAILALAVVLGTGCADDQGNYTKTLVVDKYIAQHYHRYSDGTPYYALKVYAIDNSRLFEMEVDSNSYNSVSKGDTIETLIVHP
jgi:hypothetical protein